MENISLSQSAVASLIVVAALLVADYLAVIFAVLIDLRSALSLARRNGRKSTSKGFRRSVDKTLRYLLMLLALTVVDSLIVGLIMIVNRHGLDLPCLPPLTTLGALAICLIEAKSVIENTQDRNDYKQTARALGDALSDPQLRRLVDSLRSLLKDTEK